MDAEQDGGKTKSKSRKEKPSALLREPGKSMLPFSRVQKILKVDRELPMIQREATLAISIATEDFIKRFAEATQRIADREKRTTVQQRDVATMVRKVDEFTFLEELFPWSDAEPQTRRKPKALQDREQPNDAAPTMLDRFVTNATRTNQESDTQDELDGSVVMNEDGTMSIDPH
ncbi:putative transcription factor C16C4.22 [Grifola frondosa]|uniref:Putative transcription factor C16C4.22 n=1 Tax=Grifola frondosa TaxID=5627 RepID=A0A1C7LW83_GRIFR|nr:putative transcription factor C16C4.22 [Grifola frondosa]